MADRHAEKYADVRRSASRDGDVWRITIWRLGGYINGSAQPFKIIAEYKCSEPQVALLFDLEYPDIKYAPVPKMIDDRLFVYDLTFTNGL